MIETMPTRIPMSFTLPLKMPSMNNFPRHGAKGVWAYRKIKGMYLRAVAPLAAAFHARERRHLRIDRILGPGEYAYEELEGACKPLVDALKRHGYLVNDSPRWCSREYHQEERGPQPAVRITLTATEPYVPPSRRRRG